MKKILILTFFLLLSLQMTMAGETSPGFAEIQTKEHPVVNGSFILHIKMEFNKDAKLQGQPSMKVPSGWQAQLINGSAVNKHCKKNSKFVLVYRISYPVSSLPFYPQRIQFTQLTTGDIQEKIIAEGRVYFTPYKTVEVFNMTDFNGPQRSWINPGSALDTTRKFIANIRFHNQIYLIN
ncbi:MAG: hypothetical protein K2X86_06430 [Cytophagaceae bacterium]|nr:hypothetical protein [Cytophagaceae bacterium]